MSEAVRICMIGEWLHGLPDEGIYNLARNLYIQWEKAFSVSEIRLGKDLQVNRLFISPQLRQRLRSLRPHLIFYISPSNAKMAALVRARMLKLYSPGSKVLVVATQPVAYRRYEKWLFPFLAPDGIFVQSPQGKELLQGMGCPLYFLPSGVDLNRFAPVPLERKTALRQRYGIVENALLVLHIGHIKAERNVGVLSSVAQMKDVQVILVGSASTVQDEAVIGRLTQDRVRVVREFVPHIEEYYQLADVYLFPVISEHAAIGVPLSVLEAMACNLPVVTTRFGGLPAMFPEDQGLFYFNEAEELPGLIIKARNHFNCSTRDMVTAYSWEKVARSALKSVQEEIQEWN